MSFLRATASAVVITSLSALSATAKPITTIAQTNLRKGPGTDAEVLTLIAKGTTVEIGKCTKGWCEASLNGQDGFVNAHNVGLASRHAAFRPQVYDAAVAPPLYDRASPYYGYYYRRGR